MKTSLRSLMLPALLLAAGSGAMAAKRAAVPEPDGLSDNFRAQAETVKASPTVAGAQTLSDIASGSLEKYVAGALMLQAASASGDLKAERKALTVLFESKGVPAADLPKLHNHAGVVSLMLNDPQDAIAQIRYAEQLGYKDVSGQVALADALSRTKDNAGALAALDTALTMQASSSSPMPEAWYDRVISLAVKTNQLPQVALWGQRKLAAYPTNQNWRSVLVAYLSRPGVSLEETLDIYRLAAARDALVTERDWMGYSAAANNAGAFAEAKAALEAGMSRGAIAQNDAAIKKQIAQLAPKASKELAGLKTRAAAADKSTKGDDALKVADDYLGGAEFAKAVEYYKMALSKGVSDKDRATVRLGIAQIRNGEVANGQSAMAQVTSGPWASVAGFWKVPTQTVTASAAP